ncbi:MAG: FAD-dependent oxidoreductase [Verrucomicrobiota bacterium JB023]|nr:FAD-dependent oxidoreductase [Verrucomicrobiota bacterium JB023]
MAIEIRGGGLAGCALGWRLWERGIPFFMTGEARQGASWVSAGLVNPIAGRSLNLTSDNRTAIQEAKAFFHQVEERVGRRIWHECPVLRFFANEAERQKFERRKEAFGDWLEEVLDESGYPGMGDAGAALIAGGGWLDVRAYLQASWAFFAQQNQAPGAGESRLVIHCGGSRDLTTGVLATLESRPAKGEILTVEVPGWGESRILNRGGWVVPLGNDRFRVGSTYSWDHLDEEPTEEGRSELLTLLRQFTSLPCSIVEHVAAVRPIVRRSEPVWGRLGEDGDTYFFNGLGSKGCTFGPRAAGDLVDQLEKDKIFPLKSS